MWMVIMRAHLTMEPTLIALQLIVFQKKFIGNKNITSIYRIQVYSSIMWGCFCIGFIDFMLKDKSLLDYTNLFSSKEYEKNDKIILKYF